MVACALAVASEADDYKDRELGPIHLLKYVYLGDLAFAEKNAGELYSGAPWRFYKFGPWSADVHEQIPRAAEVAGATARHITSPYTEDAVRWSLQETENIGELESRLPSSVAHAIRASVKAYHNDTYSLLHHVYRTAPMLTSEPGEALTFQVREEPEKYIATTQPELPQVSKTQLNKLKKRVQVYLADRRTQRKTLAPRVSYDEDYFEILDLLDREAGKAMEQTDGVLEFSADVWKSEARRDSGIP
jgi:hypothetical protein